MTSHPRRSRLGVLLVFLLVAAGTGIALVASGALGGEGERPDRAEREAPVGAVTGGNGPEGAEGAPVGLESAARTEEGDPSAEGERQPTRGGPGGRVATDEDSGGSGDAEETSAAGEREEIGTAGESAGTAGAGSPRAGGEGATPRPNAATPARDDSGDRSEPGEMDESAQSAAEAGATSPEVDRILARAERAYESLEALQASFEQEVHVPLLDRHRRGTGTWYQKGRSRFKMDFEDPPEDVIVADGVHLWLYYPSTNPKQVIRQSLDAPAAGRGTADVLARILEEARTAYRAEYGAREEVAGKATHRIDLTPVGRSPYRLVRVWVAADDHLVRRFEIVEENETVRTVTLRDLEPNASISDATFRFVPPADADVFAG